MKKIIIFLCLTSSVIMYSEDIFDVAREGNIDRLKTFIEKIGIDPNIKNSNGNALISYALKSGKSEIISYLMDKKVIVEDSIISENEYLFIEHPELVDLFLKYGININKFTFLLINQDVSNETLDLLTSRGINLNSRFIFNNKTAIESCMDSSSPERISYLINSGADITVNFSKDKFNLLEWIIYKITRHIDYENTISIDHPYVKLLKDIIRVNKLLPEKRRLKLTEQTDNLITYLLLQDIDNVKRIVKKGIAPDDIGLTLVFMMDSLDIFKYFKEVGFIEDNSDSINKMIEFDSITIYQSVQPIQDNKELEKIYNYAVEKKSANIMKKITSDLYELKQKQSQQAQLLVNEGKIKEALDIYISINENDKINEMYLKLGDLSLKNKMYIEAFDYFNLAGSKPNMILALNAYGDELKNQEKFEEALSIYLKSISCKKNEYAQLKIDDIKMYYDTQGDTEYSTGNYDMAMSFYKLAENNEKIEKVSRRLKDLRNFNKLKGEYYEMISDKTGIHIVINEDFIQYEYISRLRNGADADRNPSAWRSEKYAVNFDTYELIPKDIKLNYQIFFEYTGDYGGRCKIVFVQSGKVIAKSFSVINKKNFE
ncbi:MAG TPA: hypothetical protein DDY71_16495 [Spirochaetia bacterium]|nr:MAG: hypothetical protein A2Y29_08930 [Spirochaetes bacterium GWE2_31_10]HBD94641.1 hypothetical protein [Spirochaetia bacterium]HBI39243.1 hypothetical protein [Spirochaetia bacterium]